jgi:methylmalonyl-CoA carboxyltransferase 1.3S subunit
VKLTIGIDGKQYEVDVEVPEQEIAAPRPYPAYLPPSAPTATRLPSPTPQASAAAPKSDGGSVADEAKVCRSPIAGVVISISAQEGQQLQPHDSLLILEAMKMETGVTAPVAGVVKSINVEPGDAVQKDQVLVEFE